MSFEGLVGRWVSGVVANDGWPWYYITYSFPWCIQVALAIFVPLLVLQLTTHILD